LARVTWDFFAMKALHLGGTWKGRENTGGGALWQDAIGQSAKRIAPEPILSPGDFQAVRKRTDLKLPPGRGGRA